MGYTRDCTRMSDQSSDTTPSSQALSLLERTRSIIISHLLNHPSRPQGLDLDESARFFLFHREAINFVQGLINQIEEKTEQKESA